MEIDRLRKNWKVDITEGAEETLEIEVPWQMDVRGIVVDPHGVAVAGAEIIVTHPGVAPQWLHSGVKTASDGTFFLRSLGRSLLADAVDGQAEIRIVLPDAPAGLLGTVDDPGDSVAIAYGVQCSLVVARRYSADHAPGERMEIRTYSAHARNQFECESMRLTRRDGVRRQICLLELCTA